MHKKWSLYLGSVTGIKVFIHWTFLILIAWIFFIEIRTDHGLSAGIWGVLFILALFACVVLHEFGHAITARRFNISTRDITIYPIGGIASLEAMPSKPSQELQVALAGPLVNFIIALVFWIVLKSLGLTHGLGNLLSLKLSSTSFGLNLMYANVLLGAFNLIPAFPMDGGRVLRSLLAMKIDSAKATFLAARTGQFLAMVFVFLGFFYDFWLVFIGLFIFLGASAESKFEAMKHSLDDVRALNVMMPKFTVLHPDDKLEVAAKHLLNTNEKSFLVIDNDKVVGILDYRTIVRGLHEGKQNQKIETLMHKEFYWLENEEVLSDKFQLMEQAKQSLFPVRKNNKLVGIITMENLDKWIQAKPYVFKH